MAGMDVALSQQINQFLGKRGSPLAGLGDQIVSAGQSAGVDPRLLVAISGGETGFGTTGNATGLHNAWGYMGGPGGTLSNFSDWGSALKTIASDIGRNYTGAGISSIPKFGAKWAPVGAANDPRNLNSNWVKTVGDFYGQLGGSALTMPRSGGLPSTGAPAIPASPAAPALPSMGAPAAVTPVKTQTYGNLAGALLGSLGKSPGAQLNAIVNTLPKTIPTSKPGVSVAAPTHLQEPGGETGAPPGTPATKGTSSVVAAAMKYLGTPYSWGGGGPGGPSFGIQQGANTKGFDCSGLLEYAYAKQGVAIGGTTYEQWPRGQSVDRKNLRPGDAVFFHMADGYPQHVGIFMGGDKFLEAPHTGANVRVSDLSSRSDFVGARRYG